MIRRNLLKLTVAAAALIVAALVVAGVIANAMSFPHPIWLIVAGIVLPLVIAWMIARGQAAGGLSQSGLQ